MGTKIHTKDFDFDWNSVDLCAESAGWSLSRPVENVRTNCGLDKVAGDPDYNLNAAGPLEFGSGSTEETLWNAMTAAAQAWGQQPDGDSATSASNPEYTGNALASQLDFSMSANGFAAFTFAAEGTDSAGIPARAVA